MKEKYVKFFKKELVVLLILLIVVCFSFGVTYSNFIYNSDSYRAVEMFTSKLEYELDNKQFNVTPNNNLITIKVKSLNDVNSYYKVVYDNDNLDIRFFNNESNVIEANNYKTINLIVFNKSNKNEIVNIDIVGGFITNTYDDIKIQDNYYEVRENIEIGSLVTLDNKAYKLLNINSDGSYELITNSSKSITISGSLGYNSYIESINQIDNIDNSRIVSLEDIEKYTKNNLVEYTTSNYYSSAYYPLLWSVEKGAVINNQKNNVEYSRSSGNITGNYDYADSITAKNISFNNIEFINDKYKDIFLDSNYLLATRCQRTSTDSVYWGVLSIDDNTLKTNDLFDSKGNDYTVKGNSKIIVTISNKIEL